MWNKETNETRYLIETILVEPNEIRLWDFHQERIGQSQRQLGWPQLDFVRRVHSALLNKASQATEKTILRLAWFFNGYRYQYQWSQRAFVASTEPYHVSFSNAYFDLKSPFSNLKHSYRKRYDFKLQPNQSLKDKLFINQNGLLVESSIGNLFIKQQDRWLTPSLSSGCVNGVFRRYLIQHHRVNEIDLSIDDILSTNNIYLGNAIRGLWKCEIHPSDRVTRMK